MFITQMAAQQKQKLNAETVKNIKNKAKRTTKIFTLKL